MSVTKKIPLRKCTGCNEMKPKKELMRVLKDSEDNICIDTTGRKNGRGAYVCKNKECLNKAIKTKALNRSLGIMIPESILEELVKEMNSLDAE